MYSSCKTVLWTHDRGVRGTTLFTCGTTFTYCVRHAPDMSLKDTAAVNLFYSLETRGKGPNTNLLRTGEHRSLVSRGWSEWVNANWNVNIDVGMQKKVILISFNSLTAQNMENKYHLYVILCKFRVCHTRPASAGKVKY